MTAKTPTNLRILRGNPSHRPLPRGEPQPATAESCPEAPDFLDAGAVEEWRTLAPQLHALKLLTRVDVSMLAIYCMACSRHRRAEELLELAAIADPESKGLLVEREDGDLVANPLIKISHAAAETMLRIAQQFGLTPASRTRISTDPDRPKGKFDGLLA